MSNTQNNAQVIFNSYYAVSNNTSNTSFTFNNVSLRTILGSLYDEYDTFNLSLNSIMSSYTGAIGNGSLFGSALNDTCIMVKMSGLNFINHSYQISSNTNNSNSCVIANIALSRSVINTFNFYASSIYTFTKSGGDIVNITFDLLRFDNNYPSTSVIFPYLLINFTINGLDRSLSRRITFND